jgi:hypothetical protein
VNAEARLSSGSAQFVSNSRKKTTSQRLNFTERVCSRHSPTRDEETFNQMQSYIYIYIYKVSSGRTEREEFLNLQLDGHYKHYPF